MTKHSKTSNKSVKMTCLCPMCGLNYLRKKKLFWSGRGIPRKFCEECQKKVNYLNHKIDTKVIIERSEMWLDKFLSEKEGDNDEYERCAGSKERT